MTHILLEYFPLLGGILAGGLPQLRTCPTRLSAMRIVATSLLIGVGWPVLAGEILPDVLTSSICIGFDVLATAAGIIAINLLLRHRASSK